MEFVNCGNDERGYEIELNLNSKRPAMNEKTVSRNLGKKIIDLNTVGTVRALSLGMTLERF